MRASLRLIALAALLLIGCSITTSSTAHPPAPAAGDAVGRQVVARTSTTVTMLPASAGGAAVGTDYVYTMPHCGTDGPIDIDASFWDVSGKALGLDSLAGLWRLTSANEATFTSTNSQTVSLVRHDGAKEFRICS